MTCTPRLICLLSLFLFLLTLFFILLGIVLNALFGSYSVSNISGNDISTDKIFQDAFFRIVRTILSIK